MLGNLFFILYIVVVVGGFFGIAVWKFRRRPTKLPLGEDIRLKRQPGEHLRSQFNQAWENLVFRVLGWLMLLPLAVCGGMMYVTEHLMASSPVLRLGAILIPPIACIIYGGLKLFRNLNGIMNMKLGLFGERAVADQLEGLRQKGYEVFHDVPCLGGSRPFNLDHVVVGRGVVVVVETKTLRKPKGVKDGHKVSYNGEVLTWPNGATSTRELEQAVRNADWLRKQLKKEEKVDAVVHSALTFPGWYVNGGPPQAPVLVESYTRLPKFIEDRFKPRLTEAETDAAVRHLSRLCTNLGYADVE